MAKKATGQYRIRVQILPRQLSQSGANNEGKESWPATGQAFSAARDALNAGEQLTQGIAASTGSLKLRIKGRNIAVQAVDRLMIVATGEIFNVTGVSRDYDLNDTILNLDRVVQQTTTQ